MPVDTINTTIEARWKEYCEATKINESDPELRRLKGVFYSGCLGLMLDIKHIAEHGNVSDFQEIFERYRTEINSEFGIVQA